DLVGGDRRDRVHRPLSDRERDVGDYGRDRHQHHRDGPDQRHGLRVPGASQRGRFPARQRLERERQRDACRAVAIYVCRAVEHHGGVVYGAAAAGLGLLTGTPVMSYLDLTVTLSERGVSRELLPALAARPVVPPY